MRSVTDIIIKQIKPVHWKIIFFSVALIVSLIEANGRSDFTIYQLASVDLVNEINPYSHSYIDGYYYYYSLLFAYIIYPFTFSDAFTGTFLWLMINAVLLYYIIFEISEFLNISQYSTKIQILFYVLLIVFNIRTIRENFHSAQITILILFLCIYSLKFLVKDKHSISAILLAMAINIKLLALPLLVYYIYRGYLKTVSYTLLFLILFFTLPLILMPLDFYLACMQKWILLINPANDKHLIDTEERSFHSITTLISTLFLKDANDIYALPIRRYIVDLSIEQVKTIIQIVRLVFILSVLFVIKSFPFNKPENKWYLYYEVTYVLALIPLIFPHQQHYAFLLQMPAIAVIIHYALVVQKLSISEWIVITIIFLCFNLKIILGAYNEYYDHFKILTYGGILTVGVLLFYRRKINGVLGYTQ